MTAVSDANNLFPNYPGLITPVGVGVYGTGLGVLSVYPQARGQYWTYLGSKPEVEIAKGLGRPLPPQRPGRKPKARAENCDAHVPELRVEADGTRIQHIA